MQDSDWNPDPFSYWNTCYNQYCLTFGASRVDGPLWAPYPYDRPNQFIGAIDEQPYLSPFRVTAWGLKFPSSHTLDLYYGADDWGYLDLGGRWNGFNIVLGTNDWDFVSGGNHYENPLWQGFWSNDDPTPMNQIKFGWRGELQDHSLVFDCIQPGTGPGSYKCTTVTPEPSVALMVVTGLLFTLLFHRLRRRR